jgi:hypothetical protein
MKLFRLLATSAAAAMLLATNVQAQQAAPSPTPVVEIFQCTYRGSNDADDLRAVNARFNTWADRNNVTTYSAFTLTPYAYSPDLEGSRRAVRSQPRSMPSSTVTATPCMRKSS